MHHRDSPIQYLITFDICFVAGALTTAAANAYAKHLARTQHR